jgi:hypothetical protein
MDMAQTVDASRVELHELKVLQRQTRSSDHGVAVARASVCAGGREPRTAVACRRGKDQYIPNQPAWS